VRNWFKILLSKFDLYHYTEASLRAQLCIPKEGAHRNDAIRPNLILLAMRVPASSREATLLHLLTKDPMHGGGAVQVQCS
jgi:ATP-dependent DNA helicase Q4